MFQAKKNPSQDKEADAAAGKKKPTAAKAQPKQKAVAKGAPKAVAKPSPKKPAEKHTAPPVDTNASPDTYKALAVVPKRVKGKQPDETNELQAVKEAQCCFNSFANSLCTPVFLLITRYIYPFVPIHCYDVGYCLLLPGQQKVAERIGRYQEKIGLSNGWVSISLAQGFREIPSDCQGQAQAKVGTCESSSGFAWWRASSSNGQEHDQGDGVRGCHLNT